MTMTVDCRRCDIRPERSWRYCSMCGSCLTASGELVADRLMARLRGAALGEYDVIRQTGRGGMAAVYLAWDLKLARYVAVKVMFPELTHQDGMSQRFLREGRTAASLGDHPNIVRVYRAREVDRLRFFAMKYIDGCSLEQLLRSVGPLPVGVACDVLCQVAHALQYAHDARVSHRDVKPSNVMLDRHGTGSSPTSASRA
jgi:eukaryotic-like serine/threonine-protein kinase